MGGGWVLPRKVEVRATHEIMAARTTKFAFLIDQFVAALQAISPVLAGNVFAGRCGTDVLMKIVGRT
jgi:hypothetical protein